MFCPIWYTPYLLSHSDVPRPSLHCIPPSSDLSSDHKPILSHCLASAHHKFPPTATSIAKHFRCPPPSARICPSTEVGPFSRCPLSCCAIHGGTKGGWECPFSSGCALVVLRGVDSSHCLKGRSIPSRCRNLSSGLSPRPLPPYPAPICEGDSVLFPRGGMNMHDPMFSPPSPTSV